MDTVVLPSPAGVGLILGGRLADVRGRRRLIAVTIPIATALVVVSYSVGGPPMWFATFGGLCRWDGIDFRYWRRQDGLVSQDMRTLYEAPDGSIFIGTRDGGFSVYRDGELIWHREH